MCLLPSFEFSQIMNCHLQNIRFLHLRVSWSLKSNAKIIVSKYSQNNYTTSADVWNVLKMHQRCPQTLTSLFSASSISDFSSLRLSLILARLIFSIRGFFACKHNKTPLIYYQVPVVLNTVKWGKTVEKLKYRDLEPGKSNVTYLSFLS